MNSDALSYKNTVHEFPNFLSHAECDELIKLSSNKLAPSTVYTATGGVSDLSRRISKQCWLKDEDSSIVESISKRVAEITKTTVDRQELLQVVKYSPGGFFKSHHDACGGTEEHCKRMNGNAGPRYITFLIYLADDFTGGQTIFPRIKKYAVPKKGKAVLFYNTDITGKILFHSLHGGVPVKNGNKWIATKWIHMKPIDG